MTRLPSILNVNNNFKREAGSYFTSKENTPHAPGLQSLARIAVETSISSTPTIRSNGGIKRTIWLFIVVYKCILSDIQNKGFIL
jgi:hypothetical protein